MEGLRMPRSVGEARRPSGRSIRLSTGTPERKIVCPQRSDLWSGAVVLHVRHISLRATSGGLVGGVRRLGNVEPFDNDDPGLKRSTLRPERYGLSRALTNGARPIFGLELAADGPTG